MAETKKKVETEDLETRARQIVGAEPTLDEYSVAAPAQSDYQRSQEWYDTYFPTISKEEEQRREAQARNVARWQLFGNAAASIANAIGGWNGGAPVAIPEVKYPDLQTWKNQFNAERKARAVQEDADRKAYTTAYNTWLSGKNTYDRYNLKRKDEYQTALSKAKQMLQTQDWKEGQAEEAQKGKEKLQTQKHDNTMTEIEKRNEGRGGSGKTKSNKDRYDTMDKSSLTKEFESRKSNMPYADRKAKTPAAMAAALRRLDYQQGKTRTTSSSGASSSSSGGGSGTSGNGSNKGTTKKKKHNL